MNFLRPYRSDLKQISSLVELGANEQDICTVLGITPFDLERWKGKNQQVNIILKPKPRPEYTVNHPEYAPLIEEAFVCGTKRFYRFKEEYRMPTGRYKYYHAHLREVEMMMSRKKLIEYMDAFENILNGGKKGNISLGKFWELVMNMKTRLNHLAFEPESVRNLAAVAYFDDTEDLTTFNSSYGKEKVKLWMDHNVHDFFLTKPIGELLNLSNSSIESLQEYLMTAEQILADLNYGLSTASEENL